MAIMVIEGGAPNGTDLVVGDHHSNGLSRAKEAGQQIVKVVDLGDDYGMAGVRLDIAWDSEAKENLCVLLVVDAGKNSRLVGLQVVPTVIAELGRIKVSDLKAGIANALHPPGEPQ
jgi:hypothetical protein